MRKFNTYILNTYFLNTFMPHACIHYIYSFNNIGIAIKHMMNKVL